MAKPIKITPVLWGNEAVKFLEQIEVSDHQKISKSRLSIIKNDATQLKSILKSR